MMTGFQWGARKCGAFWWLRGVLAVMWLLAGREVWAEVGTNLTHKVQVSNPAMARRIEAAGGRLIGDYGSYRLYETTEQIGVEEVGNGGFEVRDNYNEISLHAGHLDTRKFEVKALRQAVGNFAGRHLHLVQFAGPVQTQWREELLAAGTQIVSYIPENTYLIYGDAACLARVQSIAAVAPHFQWEGTYLDRYKIHPKARIVDDAGNSRTIGTDLFDIQLVADDDANAATLQLLDRIKLEPFKRQMRVSHYLDLVVRLNAKDISLIAAQPEVVSILPFFPRKKLDERQDQIVAGNLTGGVPSGAGYLAWLASVGFNQAQFTNFIVDVSDSGIDDGTTSPNHFGLYTGGDPNNASRVMYNRLEGFPNTSSTLQGCDGHGTINSHIIAGYDDFTNYPFADTNGFHYGLGVCPFVSVGSSVIFDPSTYTFPNPTNLQAEAYQSGARVSNNSFGSSETEGIYDSEAQVYDLLVRDAQPGTADFATPGNQGMVIVFAAGNDGPGTQTIDTPGSAKNVITVGASENVQAFGGSDGSEIGDNMANNANDMLSFSSRGPCADGRNKPDLVAPGSHVSGGVFQATFDLTNFPDGIAGSCFTGSGVSGGPNGPYWPLGQQFYTASSGTSHATPCVSGGCALVLQYFYNQFTNLPSPAMTKAVLLNSARYLTGSQANDTLPSPSQGMGEMNLGTAFDGAARIFRDQVPSDTLTASGQSRTFVGTIPDTNNGFRVTLAWTDAPGSLVGNAYNNNLDLTVSVGGNVYKGNVFSGAYSVTGGAADVKNNVENVFLPPGNSGNFTVTVAGTSINSVGVPNGSNALCQDFALVIYNANLTPVPNVIPGGTVLAAENCTPTNGAIDPGETVTVNFALENIGTGDTTNLVATLLPNSGILSPSGSQSYGVVAANGGVVTAPFTFTAGGNCGGSLTATLQVRNGDGSITNLNFLLPLGQLVSFTNFSQNFDSAPGPALPVGWTTTHTGGESNWIVSTTAKDTAPNSVFVNDGASIGVGELVTPAIAVVSTNAQLTFRNDYNLQSTGTATGDDGGVLEIQIGSGAFTDIITAGGSFVTGGYNRTLSVSRSSPFAGRQCWSGNSSGFITSTVTLPAAAAGQTIHLKWRCGTDVNTGGTGWFIDTISLVDSMYVCCNDATDVAIGQTASPIPVAVGTNLNFNLAITNLSVNTASNVVVSDATPLNTFIASASPGFVTNSTGVSWNLGDLPGGAQTNLTLTVVPVTSGLVANTATVTSSTFDLDATNNTVTTTDIAFDPVVITTDPTNQFVLADNDVFFGVTATGAAPLSYQWYFAGVSLLGQTNSSLDLFDVQTNQGGDYTVVVSNPVSAVTSHVATLTVVAPPTFLSGPTSQVVNIGGNATFQVIATGTAPLSYQWYFVGTNLFAQTNSTLNLFDVQTTQVGGYTVVVSNLFGAVTSIVANLTVLIPPTIVTPPTNQSVVVGSNITFQVFAIGTAPLNYQWYFGGTNLFAQTNATLNLFDVQINQAGDYTVVVSNLVTAVTSVVANLVVLVPPSIVSEPTNQIVIAGSNVTFQVSAAGTAPLSYQWYFASTNLFGETNCSLNLTNVQITQAGNYTVVVSNIVSAVTSSVATLTVLLPPSFMTQPTNQIVPVGSNVTFQVTAGGTLPLNYQWYFAGTNLLAQTNSTLNLFDVQTNQSGCYTVVLSNVVTAVTSSVATLTVVAPPELVSGPTNQTAFVGTNITFQATANGALLTYQWALNGTNLFTATTNILSLTNVQPNQAGSYTLTVTNIAGVTNASAQLTVILPPLNITVTGSAISISLLSQTGLNYSLQYKDNLTDTNWITLPDSIPGTGDVITLQDPAASTTGRFYRVTCD